jgi:hypothetical protein
LVDRSEYQVKLTFWGAQAEKFSEDALNSPVAMKSVRVGDFGGKTLSFLASSKMYLDPDTEESHELRGWSVLSSSLQEVDLTLLYQVRLYRTDSYVSHVCFQL